MRTSFEDGTLTLFPEGHVDSSNAAEFDRELGEAASAHPDARVVVDATSLEYVSSAGLRAFMRLMKQTGKTLTVTNASPEIYDIFEVTGFTELMDVHRALREVSVEGCDLIGEGANGKVYRLAPDQMVKVFGAHITLDDIESEREASRRAFLLGVPCAIAFDTVRVGDSYGTVYEMLNAATVSERVEEDPSRIEELAKAIANLLRKLHQTEIPEGQLPNASAFTHGPIDKVADDFTPQEVEQMHALWDSVPRDNKFIHNDYHTKNIMESQGEIMLIDLGDAAADNPVIDIIHCYMVFLLIGGGTAEHDDDEMSFIGITYGHLREFWRVFIDTYCGSEEKARQLEELIEPYARLMYLTSSMSHPRLPKQYHPVYANKLRELVLSRYDEILGSLAEVKLP